MKFFKDRLSSVCSTLISLPEKHGDLQFGTIPTKKQFVCACTKFLGAPPPDCYSSILDEVMRMLEWYPQRYVDCHDERSRVRALAILYSLCEAWISLTKGQRDTVLVYYRPAIRGLLTCLSRQLARDYDIYQKLVPTYNRKKILCPVVTKKKLLDDQFGIKLTPGQRARLEIDIFNGRVYYKHQLDPLQRMPASIDTSGWTRENIGNTAVTGFEKNNCLGVCGYVCTYERNIYIAPHRKSPPDHQGCFYHSTYVNGEPVLCAGAMTIVNGRIVYINNFSGHYKPRYENFVFYLETLRMMGIDLTRVQVQDHACRDQVFAAKQYLRQARRWDLQLAINCSGVTN